MVTNAEILQFARILGKSDFFGCISLAEEEDLQTLTPQQLDRVHELVDSNVNRVTRTFVHEAMAEDAVETCEDAERWLQERLRFFGELLNEAQRTKIADGYRLLTCGWGSAS